MCDLAVHIGAHVFGKGAILDPEHQLQINEQAAHVEISRADVHRVVHDEQLGVKLGRAILEHLHALAQQTGIGEARRPDRAGMVGDGGVHDAHPRAPLRRPVETAQDGGAGREIARDDVDAAPRSHVRLQAPRPGRQPLGRAA
jgi:hypothetical protein